jgi:hypothetical protein
MQRLEAYTVPTWYQIRQERNLAPDNRLIGQLVDLGMTMPTRKRILGILPGESFPSPIKEAKTTFKERFGITTPLNKAIIKRYVPADNVRQLPAEPSGAYEWHSDPEEFIGQNKFLCLWSVTGRATFRTKTDGGIVTEWICSPNTGLFIPAYKPVEHTVSEPNTKYGTRILLFFGESDKPFSG